MASVLLVTHPLFDDPLHWKNNSWSLRYLPNTLWPPKWSFSHDLSSASRAFPAQLRRYFGSSHEVFSPYSAKRFESTYPRLAWPGTFHFQVFSTS